MVGEFAHDGLREHRRASGPAGENLRRGRCRDHDVLAAAARPLFPVGFVLDEVAGSVLQPAGDVDAKLIHHVVTGGHVRSATGTSHVHVALDPSVRQPGSVFRVFRRRREVPDAVCSASAIWRSSAASSQASASGSIAGPVPLCASSASNSRDLSRVEALGVAADPLAPQFEHQQLELAICHETAQALLAHGNVDETWDFSGRARRGTCAGVRERWPRRGPVHRRGLVATPPRRASCARVWELITINWALIASNSAMPLLNAFPRSTRARHGQRNCGARAARRSEPPIPWQLISSEKVRSVLVGEGAAHLVGSILIKFASVTQRLWAGESDSGRGAFRCSCESRRARK